MATSHSGQLSVELNAAAFSNAPDDIAAFSSAASP
jgi:hypothetical protein